LIIKVNRTHNSNQWRDSKEDTIIEAQRATPMGHGRHHKAQSEYSKSTTHKKSQFKQTQNRFISGFVKGRLSINSEADPKPVDDYPSGKRLDLKQDVLYPSIILSFGSSSFGVIHLSQYFFTFPICRDDRIRFA